MSHDMEFKINKYIKSHDDVFIISHTTKVRICCLLMMLDLIFCLIYSWNILYVRHTYNQKLQRMLHCKDKFWINKGNQQLMNSSLHMQPFNLQLETQRLKKTTSVWNQGPKQSTWVHLSQPIDEFTMILTHILSSVWVPPHARLHPSPLLYDKSNLTKMT